MKQLPHTVAVLRASGRHWDAAAVLRQHRLHTRAVWWSAGSQSAANLETESGFNLVIADAASGSELGQRLAAWLHEHQGLLEALRPAGAKGVLKIFLPAQEPEHPAPGVILAAADVALLARSGIELAFAAPPGHA